MLFNYPDSIPTPTPSPWKNCLPRNWFQKGSVYKLHMGYNTCSYYAKLFLIMMRHSFFSTSLSVYHNSS